jgi:8-demethyl-8-alpha-L-rhamnosyltetracenomycin-C 2'-O-methyltransferase
MERQSIVELMKLYPTDKNVEHSYGPVYDELFAPVRDRVMSLLEIGVYQGGSLRVWRDYFPNAHILGIDVNPAALFTDVRITTARADAQQWAQLYPVVTGKTFDLIIDDGGHKLQQQVMALFYLWPFLRRGGMYVIEDLEDSRFMSHFNCFTNLEIVDRRTIKNRWDDILLIFRKS